MGSPDPSKAPHVYDLEIASPFFISSLLRTISVPVFTYAYGEKRTPCNPTNVAKIGKSLSFKDWRISFAVPRAVLEGTLDCELASVHEFPVNSVSEQVCTSDFPHHAKRTLVHNATRRSIFFMILDDG